MTSLQFLLLEPDAERRQALAELLRAAGHRVLDTGDANAAAESLGAPGFDVLVLELGLPSFDAGALQAAICPSAEVPPVSLDAAERLHIARTLEHTAGNRRQAALILGISRSTLLHKIRKYGLDANGARRR
jgi:DNA-binding NtrC family response regulator